MNQSIKSYWKVLKNLRIQQVLVWKPQNKESIKCSWLSGWPKKNPLGYPVGRRKTRILMREAGVFVRYKNKYRVPTNSNHKQPVFDNVVNRQFQKVAQVGCKRLLDHISRVITPNGMQY